MKPHEFYLFWKFPILEALSYAQDLQCAIMGGRDGTLVLWDINHGDAKRELSDFPREGSMGNWNCRERPILSIFTAMEHLGIRASHGHGDHALVQH